MTDIINFDKITNKEILLQYREKLLNESLSLKEIEESPIQKINYQVTLPRDTETLQKTLKFMALWQIDRKTNFKRLQSINLYHNWQTTITNQIGTNINIEIINPKEEKRQRILTPFLSSNNQESMDKIA